jgi:anti-sigma regulatory factor (Ser/Thr protein kinase)
MEQLGRNPGRIIGAWRDFMREHGDDGAAPLGIGEPIWPGRNEAELVECHRHETLLNLAFTHAVPWTLLCPYDAAHLPDEVLDAALRNHAHVTEHGEPRRSDAFVRAIPAAEPLPAPADDPPVMRFSHGDLAFLRDRIAGYASAHGLAGSRVDDLVLAVDELATNSLRYARGEGTLRTWCEDGSLLVEVADEGHIADPLAGRYLPAPEEIGGRGLFLVNQLCDLVQVRSSPEGSVVRLHMQLA